MPNRVKITIGEEFLWVEGVDVSVSYEANKNGDVYTTEPQFVPATACVEIKHTDKEILDRIRGLYEQKN